MNRKRQAGAASCQAVQEIVGCSVFAKLIVCKTEEGCALTDDFRRLLGTLLRMAGKSGKKSR